MYAEIFYTYRDSEKLGISIPGISTLNKTTADENVTEIEQHIREIKEHERDLWINLTFNKTPGRIFIEMILFVLMWLNAFPPVGGISQIYYSRKIMTDCTLYYSKECRVEFGTYTKTHEDATIINNMDERLQGYIYIWTTKKLQDT